MADPHGLAITLFRPNPGEHPSSFTSEVNNVHLGGPSFSRSTSKVNMVQVLLVVHVATVELTESNSSEVNCVHLRGESCSPWRTGQLAVVDAEAGSGGEEVHQELVGGLQHGFGFAVADVSA